MMKKEELKEKYLSSGIFYNRLKKKEEKLLLIVSVLRLITFIGGVLLIWLGFTVSISAGFALTFIILILFLYLLKLFSLHSEKGEYFSNLALINQNEADALSGNYSAFDTGSSYIDIKHDFSFDVDLFGVSSLFQYINRTVTGYGRDILAGWLSDPFNLSAELESRQGAVKELSSKDKWRQEFMACGMTTPLGMDEISGVLEWVAEKGTENYSSFKKILIILMPAAVLVSILLWASGIISYSLFVFLFLCNLIYVGAGLKRTNVIHKALSRKYIFLSSMNGMLKAFENEPFDSPVLNNIKLNLSGKKTSASGSVRRLGRLIQSFDSRNNLMVGFLLNGLLLWDYQSINRLEKWKSDYRNFFPLWLGMLGTIDAYISFGNYAFNNPGYAYPVKSDDREVFSARDLGHQLIDENKRVCNNFHLGKKGTVCIISGANMAGKSTFLRTIAVNFILGMAGAPVCASEMNFMPAKIFTSMRTVDSLSDNESYFYAELRRLSILKSRIEKGEPLFFILDEILKGTNSEDKSAGSKLFLQRIIENGGTGLIATHDTSLAKLELSHPEVINKCFEIEIDGENIKFDYKIQDGITQKMNAVFLMRQMGILD
jgi:ABC-type multidrug transport system fused ATPase/permease subunit